MGNSQKAQVPGDQKGEGDKLLIDLQSPKSNFRSTSKTKQEQNYEANYDADFFVEDPSERKNRLSERGSGSIYRPM